MKKKTVIRTERHEVWVIRQGDSSSHSREHSPDSELSKDPPVTNTEEVKPQNNRLLDEGDEDLELTP